MADMIKHHRYKTRRQQRYLRLRNSGFLPFEAQELSKVPNNVPYMANLYRNRKMLLGRAKKDRWSYTKYESSIKKLYDSNRWYRARKRDPWQMLKVAERRYKTKHPEYSSPWKKRRKDFVEFTRKLEQDKKRKLAKNLAIQERYLRTQGL